MKLPRVTITYFAPGMMGKNHPLGAEKSKISPRLTSESPLSNPILALNPRGLDAGKGAVIEQGASVVLVNIAVERSVSPATVGKRDIRWGAFARRARATRQWISPNIGSSKK